MIRKQTREEGTTEEGRNRGQGVRVTAVKYSDTHAQKWCKKKPGVLFGNYIKKESKITKGAQPSTKCKAWCWEPRLPLNLQETQARLKTEAPAGPPRMSSQPALSPSLTSISSSLWASGLDRLI